MRNFSTQPTHREWPTKALLFEIESIINTGCAARAGFKSGFKSVESSGCVTYPAAIAMIAVGTRLGSYQITSLLGQGGMGEVYRATDTKLNRDLALKFLPEQFASDPDRLERFRREARVLASLNHSNIAAIYGFEGSASMRALVMELVGCSRRDVAY